MRGGIESTMSEGFKTAGREAFQAEFESLPLEEKVARLFRLELATFCDVCDKVAEASARFFTQAGEAVSDIGRKINAEFRKASCGNGPSGGSTSSGPNKTESAPSEAA